MSEAVGFFVVLSTVPEGRGERMAEVLVGRGVAACVSVLPAISSVYRWQGAVERAREEQLVCKTARPEALAAAIRELHPYDLPEIIVLSAEGAGEDSRYARWVMTSSSEDLS